MLLLLWYIREESGVTGPRASLAHGMGQGSCRMFLERDSVVEYKASHGKYCTEMACLWILTGLYDCCLRNVKAHDGE